MNELRNDYIGFSRSLLRFIKKSFPSDDGSRLHIDIDGINYSEFNPDIYLLDHHEAHAANAYYCSGSGDTLVLTLDGAGSGKSGTLWLGQDGELDHIRSWDVSGSLGWFYGVVTEAFGWVMNNGEGKTMGLAAFTESDPSVETELKRICPEYEDGELVSGIDWEYTQSYRGNDIYSRYYQQVDHVKQLIERYGREDVAAATQSLLESQVMNIVEHWLSRLDVDQIASSGGIFLNVKLNSLIKNKTDVQSHFTFPNAGDGGLPVGAAFTGWKKERGSLSPFNFSDVYAGPDLVETTSYETIEDILDERGLLYTQEPNVERKVAELLHEGRTVAWCQGKMEYGPRALGNRSILANPTNNQNKDRVNNRVKFREAWRPFAPSILEEAADKYLIDPLDDPFMISSASVKEDKLDQIPAVVHVDGTSRPQIVKKRCEPSVLEVDQ